VRSRGAFPYPPSKQLPADQEHGGYPIHQSINRSNQRTFPFGSTDIPTQQTTTTVPHPDDLDHPLQSSFPTSPDPCPPHSPRSAAGKKQRVERGRRSETSSRFFGSNTQRQTTVTTSFIALCARSSVPPFHPESDPKKRQLFEFQGRRERICLDHEISGIPLNPHTNTTGGPELEQGGTIRDSVLCIDHKGILTPRTPRICSTRAFVSSSSHKDPYMDHFVGSSL
jgi:hypothetical protein